MLCKLTKKLSYTQKKEQIYEYDKLSVIQLMLQKKVLRYKTRSETNKIAQQKTNKLKVDEQSLDIYSEYK